MTAGLGHDSWYRFDLPQEEEEWQGAVSLALCVCGRVGQVVAEASLGVSVVVRDAVGGGVGHVAREAGLVVGLGFGQFERRHRPRWFRHRHTSALQVWPLVMWEDLRSRLVARWFRGANVEWWTGGDVYWRVVRFVVRVMLLVELRRCRAGGEVRSTVSSVCFGSKSSRLRCSVSVVVGAVGAAWVWASIV